MSEHTPGPWTTDRRNGRVVISGETLVATAFLQEEPTVARENARLIAAAPELLEALKEVIEDGLKTNMESWITKANKAIAKATGASP